MDEQKRKSYWVYETTVPPKDRIVFSKTFIRSPAFIKLTGAAKQILLELYMRLKLDSHGKRNDKRFFAANNGKLVITYKSITAKFGYSSATISKAIDRLVNYGFIEIAELGCGVKRQSHKIALIINWQDYGTDNFKAGNGKADEPVGGGFKTRKPLQSKVGTPLQCKVVAGKKLPKVG